MILATAPGVLASAPAPTKVVYVAPVDSHGRPLPNLTIFIDVRGTCEPGSDSVPGPVYRCFDVGNSVLDPCWADKDHAGAVLCMPSPWSQNVVELDTKALPASTEPVPKSLAFPWGVQLANGEKCLAAQGAHDEYRGRVVDYACGKTYRLVLLRGMHQSQEPWTFDSAIWTGKEYIPGPTETVRIAWYGGPSPAAKR
jgi:hypothetical protein